jgi:hypothetical protein
MSISTLLEYKVRIILVSRPSSNFRGWWRNLSSYAYYVLLISMDSTRACTCDPKNTNCLLPTIQNKKLSAATE